MTDRAPLRADDVPLTDRELREMLVLARAQDHPQVVRLVTSYVTLRRVTADVVAAIEEREGGAAVAKSPLLLRARELSARILPSGTT
ncbi:MAG TPA: hypothetical protein VFS59_03310 [Gemmatimonadaceae bacterium]|nr:hypothetical protein [Gemmatimonadaceae bacterium]